MLKTSMGFLAGAATITAVMLYAGTRMNVVCFAAGAILTAAIAAAPLTSTRRMRAAARFLNRAAEMIDNKPPRQVRAASPKSALSAEPRRPAQLDGAAAEVATALRNLGASRKQADELARFTAAQLPGANFETMFRAAMQARQAAA